MMRGGENNFKHKSFNILNEKKKYSGTKKEKRLNQQLMTKILPKTIDFLTHSGVG